MDKVVYKGGVGTAYTLTSRGHILTIEDQEAEIPLFSIKVKVAHDWWAKPQDNPFQGVFDASIGRIQQVVQQLRFAFIQAEGDPPDQMVLFLSQGPYIREIGTAKEDLVPGPRAQAIGSASSGWVVGCHFGLVARLSENPGGDPLFPFEKSSSLSVKGGSYGMSVEDLTPLVGFAIQDAFHGAHINS
jgi:hypothetical protein